MSHNPYKRFGVAMTAETYQKTRRLASDLSVPMSQVVAEAINHFVLIKFGTELQEEIRPWKASRSQPWSRSSSPAPSSPSSTTGTPDEQH